MPRHIHLLPNHSYSIRTALRHSQHQHPYHHHHDHHVHYSTSSSEVRHAGTNQKDSLTAQLRALCKAGPDDQEAIDSLEGLVQDIKPFDDPEGLLRGAAYLKLATYYVLDRPNLMKGILYAQEAVQAYEPRGPSLKLATSLYMSALIFVKWGDMKEALHHLARSDAVMKRMRVTPCDKYCVALKHDLQCIMGEACDQFCNEVKFELQLLFGTAKMHLRMHGEAVAHFHNSVKLKQKLSRAGSPALGVFYLDMAGKLRLLNDHKTATHLCRKALKIFCDCLCLPEEAEGRSLLSEIHFDLGKYEESLRESELARSIWKRLGNIEDVISLDLKADRSFVQLKRWTEALSRLEEVIEATVVGNRLHTIALILAARVCVLSNNDDCATRYCRRALKALERQWPCSQTAEILVLLASVYEDRKEFKQAAFFCKKAKEIIDECFDREATKTAAELEGKVGSLLVHAGNVEEAIPHLESSFSKLKNIPGKDLLYVHFYLGLAYPQVEKYQEALEHFEAAKLAITSSGGISASMQVAIHSNLAATYSALDRLDEAIECQKIVVDLLKNNKVDDYALEEVEMRLKSYIKEGELLKERNGKF